MPRCSACHVRRRINIQPTPSTTQCQHICDSRTQPAAPLHCVCFLHLALQAKGAPLPVRCSKQKQSTLQSANVREKEMKRQTLLELVDYVNTGTGKFTELVSEVGCQSFPRSAHADRLWRSLLWQDAECNVEGRQAACTDFSSMHPCVSEGTAD